MRHTSVLAWLGLAVILLVSAVHAQDEGAEAPEGAGEAPAVAQVAPVQEQENAREARLVAGQDEEAPDQEGGEEEDQDQEGEEGEEGEECEEAWDYVEFLKGNIKDPIETIMQDTLFQPRPLLEETVTQTMEKVLEIRDDILARTKSIRTEDGEVTICPEQNINQEEFLTQIRMQIMSILLSLIEKDAASPESLQDVGKQLLAIRTKVNTEITRMIMLRETTASVRPRTGDCDCGILDEVVDGLDQVVDTDNQNQNQNQDEGEEEEQEDGEEPEETEQPEEGEGEEGQDGAGGQGGNPVEQLTMVLMTVDAEIKNLYNQILAELDDEARQQLSQELQDLKAISTDLHEVLSKLSSLDPEQDQETIARLIRREVRGIRNEVRRLLDICQQRCPGECDSCGADKIDEVAEKLRDYNATLQDLPEEDAKENIRTDLMAYLTQTNNEMTELLKEKAESGELDDCGTEQLEVIDKIKGPLWMMVNITIFGDASTMSEMIDALDQALMEMRLQYCSAENATTPEQRIASDECDLDEINNAREWIGDVDDIISNDIFKSEDEDGRRNAMLGLIELKSSMDNRVRELFQDNLQCKEEVEQIKNIYMQKLTECLAEMMNPRFRFDLLGRAERVQCVKDLRILMEDRRGELLMREIEKKINQEGSQAVGASPNQEQ